MTTNQKIYSISGRVKAISDKDGITSVTIDSTAYGQVPTQGVDGPLNNFFYSPGGISAEQEAVFVAAQSSKAGVTVYFTMGGDAGRVVSEVRYVAEQAITATQNIFMCNGQRWSPKGVCYQPYDEVDPISDDDIDTIAALLDPNTEFGLFQLGINCLRVYQIDPSKKHDQVMQLLAKNGIYVLVGAVNSSTAIPRTASSVPAATVTRVQQVADAFASYSNVLGFSISNELLDNGSASEYGLVSIVKQVKQHMQSYMASKSYRAIPIGCCTRDDPTYTFPATLAYACGDAATRMDFIGYNCYRWVVQNGQPVPAGTLNTYYELYAQFNSFPVPVMLTEIGAQYQGGRDWSQIAYIFGQDPVATTPPNSLTATLSDAISGCFAFRYYEQGDGFGLVTPVASTNPTAITSGNGGGYAALSAAYQAVTAFSGNANGVDKLSCSSLSGNPYAGNNTPTDGLPTAITVTLTNAITNPATGRKIAFSYSLQANPTTTDWIPAVTIPPQGAAQQFTFPAGTQAISMAFEVSATEWDQGCQLQGPSLLALQNGQTIQGNWVAPGGAGACPVV